MIIYVLSSFKTSKPFGKKKNEEHTNAFANDSVGHLQKLQKDIGKGFSKFNMEALTFPHDEKNYKGVTICD